VSERNPLQEATSSSLIQRQRADRRREQRHTITLPVRVAGADCHNRPWSEIGKTINVSSGGMALRLSTQVTIGDILFLELSLPARFLKRPNTSGTYKTYALVRYLEMKASGHQIVRLQFLRESARVHQLT